MRSCVIGLGMVSLVVGCGDSTTPAPDVNVDVATDVGASEEVVTDSESVDTWTGDGVSSDLAPDAGEEPKEDLTEAMFDPDRLLEVEISLSNEDWDLLRQQTRTIFDIFGPPCMEGPFESPFTYFEGSVTVDGELMENVGVHKKGFLGSLSENRPSLKLKFGEYIDGQELQGLKRMTLNNSRQDLSVQHQCLAYGLFRKAGLVAPRCNWAKVTVNGTYLGVYVHVESIKKPFIRRNFPDETGTLWEGTLSDFRDAWLPTFEQKLNKGTDDAARLWAVRDALEADDAQLFDALNAHIDMEQFFTFWAMEVLVGHWDGYAGNTNNFYLYERPDDGHRLNFIPWGTDGTFTGSSKEAEEEESPPASVMATGVLPNRLYQVPETRFYYLQRLQVLLDTLWDKEALLSEIQTRQQWLAPHVLPELKEWMNWATDALSTFVKEHPAQVQAELDQGGLDWGPPLRDTFCMKRMGSIEASYSTSWGTLHTANAFEVGTGEFGGVYADESFAFQMVGSSADEGKNDSKGRAVIGIFGLVDGVDLTFLILQTSLGDFVPKTTVLLDGTARRGHSSTEISPRKQNPRSWGSSGTGSGPSTKQEPLPERP